MGVALLYAYRAQSPSAVIVTYDKAVSEIQSGVVTKVTISGDAATLEKPDKSTETVNIGPNDNGAFQKIVTDYNTTQPTSSRVQLSFQKDSQTFGIIGSVLLSLLPVLLIGGFFVYMMRQAQGTNNQALSFGKSRARMFIGNKPATTFDDVAGVDEAKQELTEVVEFLKYPEKFSTLGARIPRGVLPGGPARHRQDDARARGRRRGRRPVLLDLGIRVRRDVRRRRRVARARPVRPGEAQRAVHRVHRRDRRGRAASAARASADRMTSASRP